ncbi:cysteine/serine endopeptidase inhibitor [Streptomyces sp. NPDC001514]
MNVRKHRGRWAAGVLGAVSLALLGAGTAIATDPVAESDQSKMTWYDLVGVGACGTPVNAEVEDLVAVPHAWWTAANPNEDDLCKGVYVEVSYNGKTITVPVRDKCPAAECGPGHIDLSKSAFQKLAPLEVGVVNGITWRFVGSGGEDVPGQTPETPETEAPAPAETETPAAEETGTPDAAETVAPEPAPTETVAADDGPESETYEIPVTESYATPAPLPSTQAPTQPGEPGCGTAPGWDAGRSYVPGEKVTHAGKRYTATFYSTGAAPGDPISWAVWEVDGAC